MIGALGGQDQQPQRGDDARSIFDDAVELFGVRSILAFFDGFGGYHGNPLM